MNSCPDWSELDLECKEIKKLEAKIAELRETMRSVAEELENWFYLWATITDDHIRNPFFGQIKRLKGEE